MRTINVCLSVAIASILLVACDDGATGGTGGSGASSSDQTSTGKGSGTGSQSTGAGMTTGSGGAPMFEGTTRVDTANASAVPGSADAAVAPDGTIYVSWVDETAGSRDVFVARSTDGGKTFEAAIKLDDAAIVPLVSMARHPYVFANDTRVGVVFNDQAGAVYLYVSQAGGALTFGQPTLVGTDIVTVFRDFPKGFFLGDGTIAVAYHGYPASGERIFLSRETNNYNSEDASNGAPGYPCECCPIDTLLTQSGDVLLAFRNNDSNTRDMWFATAPSAGTFSDWGAISTTEGFLDTCPMQGPRLAQTSATELFAVWSARGQGNSNTGAVYLSKSSDGGGSWSGGAPIPGFTGDEPTIVRGAAGHLFITAVTGSNKSVMIESTDNGANWSAPTPIQVADGTLGVPQPDGNGGVAVIAGVSAGNTVWLDRME